MAVTVELYRTVFVVQHTQARGFARYQFDGDRAFGDRTRRLVHRVKAAAVHLKVPVAGLRQVKVRFIAELAVQAVGDRRCHFIADDFFVRIRQKAEVQNHRLTGAIDVELKQLAQAHFDAVVVVIGHGAQAGGDDGLDRG